MGGRGEVQGFSFYNKLPSVSLKHGLEREHCTQELLLVLRKSCVTYMIMVTKAKERRGEGKYDSGEKT